MWPTRNTWHGHPAREPATKRLRGPVSELGVDAEITAVNVVDNDQALSRRLLGSPFIQVNGTDLEIGERQLTQFSLRCLVHQHHGELSGIPSREALRQKILENLK